MKDFEVRRVANGWMVMPPHYGMGHEVRQQDDMYVFPNAELLAAFIRDECQKEEAN